MIAIPLIRVAAATGGLALSLAAGAGSATAGPDDAAINTTCTYPQVVAAINDQSPAAAAELNSTPIAQQFLQTFMASPAPQRQQMLDQAKGIPEAAEFVGLIQPLADTCHNYPVAPDAPVSPEQ
jgi:hemophore-related protein